tara:strand:+ start:111 stop:611 length:501 start_codon:yes stop_codon:yes gene_type:complete
MRKLFILILAVTFTACNAPAEQVGAGFFTPVEGENYVIGSDEVTDVWVKYIDAHNNRDMDAIMEMNSDSISITGPDGARINGKEMHEQALTAWFEAENPRWETFWAMPYKAVQSGSTWVIAGHRMTLDMQGEEVNVWSMIDAEIVDGKVSRFFVYNRASSPEVSEE